MCDAVASIGDLLLKGWIMTADGCAECKVCLHCAQLPTLRHLQAPLMKNPQDDSLYCASCQETKQNECRNEICKVEETIQAEQEVQMDDRLGPYASTSHKMDVSDMLAQRMIQGYTLLSENCPDCHTPLVSKQPNIRPLCVACHVQIMTENPPIHTKRNSRNSEEVRIPSDKIKHCSGFILHSQNLEEEEMDWLKKGENILKMKTSKLLMELEASNEDEDRKANLLNSYLEALLKLKQLSKS